VKILAFGDSLRLPTGYGRVSANVLPYFALKGHEVLQLGGQHSEPPETLSFNDGNGHSGNIALLPCSGNYHDFSSNVKAFIESWHPDMVYNSNDFFTSSELMPYKKEHPFYMVQYGILDGPDAAEAFRDIIINVDAPITPSKYGYEQLIKVNPDGMYIPHGVNTDIYKPLDKEMIKKKFGLEGKFVFGGSNRNIYRKQYVQILKSFAELKYKHGIKDAVLFLACQIQDWQGPDLSVWANKYNLSISNKVEDNPDILIHPHRAHLLYPLSDAQLAETYNAWDIHLSASMAEGFGLTTIESEACGVPSIICDNSSNTELVQDHGWLFATAKGVSGEELLIPATLPEVTYGYTMPDYTDMTRCMLEAYHHQELVKELGAKSHQFAQNYSWNKVLPLWDQVLENVN
jgi:glycosyltransferase involved in cell wall biosynthesis